jgi:hypothetical protein
MLLVAVLAHLLPLYEQHTAASRADRGGHIYGCCSQGLLVLPGGTLACVCTSLSSQSKLCHDSESYDHYNWCLLCRTSGSCMVMMTSAAACSR